MSTANFGLNTYEITFVQKNRNRSYDVRKIIDQSLSVLAFILEPLPGLGVTQLADRSNKAYSFLLC